MKDEYTKFYADYDKCKYCGKRFEVRWSSGGICLECIRKGKLS